MYSGGYDVCDVTLSVYPHRASLKNMLGHGGNRTYDLWNNNNNNTNYLYSAKVMYELFIYRLLPPFKKAFQKKKLVRNEPKAFVSNFKLQPANGHTHYGLYGLRRR